MESTPPTTDPVRAGQAAGERQVCPNCKANLAWDADAGALRCDRCGELTRPDGDEGDAGVVERDLEAGLSRPQPSWDLGSQAREVTCGECGATVEFPDGLAATACSFCGSPQVLAQAARRELVQPESVVPFGVARTAAEDRFKLWISKLWFRPSDLKHEAEIAELRGVYVPFWTFDCAVDSSWTAQAGYYYYVTVTRTVTVNGQRQQRQERERRIRWEPASGQRHDRWDDHLVCASKGLPDELAADVSDFETRALRPYDPAFLQGFLAESYAVDLRGAWDRAEAEITREQTARCGRDVPGDTHRFLRARHRVSQTTFKHVLLPVWVAAFRYRDKVFRFLVNGQTGKVAGNAPYSVWKIVGLVLVLLALAAAGLFLFRQHG